MGWLSLLQPLIGPLVSALGTLLLSVVTNYMASQRDQALGEQTVTAAVATKTATVEVAEAQAEATAPHTLDATLAALRAGTA